MYLIMFKYERKCGIIFDEQAPEIETEFKSLKHEICFIGGTIFIFKG